MTKKKKYNLKKIIKKEYSKSWNYIKESKKFIWAVLLIFFIFALAGFFLPAPETLSDKILSFLKELLTKTEGMQTSQLIKFIFFNNVQTSFIAMIFGILLGIFPLIYTIINGYLLGFVSNMAVQEESILSLWRIFPHGIFELPAMFISFALGIKLGMSIIYKKKFGAFNNNIKLSLKTFILIVIPLLITAAIIEGTLIMLGN